MRFIFTADVHLKMWSDKEYTDDGLPLKLKEILDAVEQMCVYAEKNNIENIIIGGDLNDTKGIASVRAFVLFKQLVSKHPDIHFYILHGNHDAVASEYQNVESAVQLVDGYDNVTTITSTHVVDNLLFIPYSKTIGEEISNSDATRQNILISHFGLNEATLSSGISIKSSISARHLEKFNLVLLGHYHKPQKIVSGNVNIYYVGSPIAIRRDEAGEVKRFLVVDSDTCEVVEVPTEGYRKYYEFVLNEDSDINAIKEEIKRYKEEGHHVVLKNMMANIPDKLQDVVENVQYVDLYEPDITIRGITAAMTIEEQLKKYIEIESVPEEKQETYLKIGIDCVTAAGESKSVENTDIEF